MFKGKFNDIVLKDEGFLRGPFGSTLKKSLFVPKSVDAYKVYEQSVVLEKNKNLGKYYISKEYFESKLKSFEVKSGDFLVSCSGVNYGEIYELEGKIEKGVINQALLRVRINEKIIDRNYFLYYFRAYIAKVITGGSGDSTIPNFPPMDFVKNVEVELPDLVIQRKIGRILKKIDKKYELNNQINNNLEELMKTIYQRWFIEFEFPNEEGKPYKSNGGKLVYNEELKYRIPEKWKVDNCYETNMFEIIKPGVQWFEIKNYLATGNVEGNNITNGVYVGYDNRESRANMQPLPNSIWFAKMKNSIKHITLSSNSEWFNEKYILSTGFLGIKCKEDTLCYLHCFIYSDYFEKVKDMLAHGATQEAINNEDLKAIKLIVPDKRVLKLFENYTKAIIQDELDVIHENQRLDSLKEFILPLLMNGQINVDDIEI